MPLALRPLEQVIRDEKSNSHFENLESIAEEFCSYLRRELGIDAHAIHDFERDRLREKFMKMSEEQQLKKLKGFRSYYLSCLSLVESNVSLIRKKKSLETFLYRHRLVIPKAREVFACVDDDTMVEVYNREFIQCYRSPDYFDMIHHSVMALESCEWWELFFRSDSVNEKVMAVVEDIYNQRQEEPVFSPVEPHTVKEINCSNPFAGKAEMKLLCPVFLDDGTFEGMLHVFKIKALQKLSFTSLAGGRETQPEL